MFRQFTLGLVTYLILVMATGEYVDDLIEEQDNTEDHDNVDDLVDGDDAEEEKQSRFWLYTNPIRYFPIPGIVQPANTSATNGTTNGTNGAIMNMTNMTMRYLMNSYPILGLEDRIDAMEDEDL